MIFPKRWVKAEIYSKKFEIWWCKANEMEFGFHKLNTWSSVQRVLCWVKFIKFQAVVLDVFQDFQVQKSLETGRDRSTPWGLTPMISHESPPSFLAHRRWKDNLRRTAIYIYIYRYTYKAKSWDFSTTTTKIISTLYWITFLAWTCVFHCNTFEYNQSQAFLPSFHLAMFLHEGSGHQVEMMLDPNQAPLHAFGRYFFGKMCI